MAFDITLNSPAYNPSGKFGQSLSGGNGSVSGLYAGVTNLTIELWVKASTAPGSLQVICGGGGDPWIGMSGNGSIEATYSTNGDNHVYGTTVITDGAWHHVAICIGSTTSGIKLFVDGILQGSNAGLSGFASGNFGIRKFGAASDYLFGGQIDELAVSSIIKYTGNFTPPTAAVANNAANLIALWHFDGDGINSAGLAVASDTTAPVMTGLLASSAITASGFTLTWPAATDAVGVTGYEYSTDGGTSYADAGNVLTKVITGLTANTGYAVRVRAYDAAGNKSTPALAATVTTAAASSAYDPAKILFAPYVWDVQPTYAKAINGGAYFKFAFSGQSCTLTFDMTGVSAPVPKLIYRVDNSGPWITVDLAASIAITIPSDVVSNSHYLEMMVKATSEAVSRWSPQSCAVVLTGIALASGSETLTKPTALPLNALYLGDSITDGVNTITSSGDNTVRANAQTGWAYMSAQILGAEMGNVGFGGQGLTVTGAGSVPVFGSTWNYIYSGVARSFAVPPDYIVINQGSNDGGNNITTAATSVLNAIISATPATTKIIVMRPFNGSHDSEWIAAIAATTTPARIARIDTTGFNVGNALHPDGFTNIMYNAPLVAAAIRPLLQITRGTRTSRTVTLTLNDRSGNPRANLSGIKWAFFDQATAGALVVNADSGTNATTNASGVLTLSVLTTLAPGATGWLVLSDSAGNAATASNAFSGPVTVA